MHIVHMKSLHKDMEGRVNGCDRRRLQKSLKRKTEETSLIEEEQIELVNNIFVSGQELGENVNTKYPSKVESEKVSITKKRRNKIGEKVMYSSDKNHQDVESEVLSECNTIESKKKGTPKREGTRDKMSKVNAEVTLSNCKYCPFKIPGRKYFKAKLRMHNKTKHFVCEICRKKHENKDDLDVHMTSLHKDIDGRVICGGTVVTENFDNGTRFWCTSKLITTGSLIGFVSSATNRTQDSEVIDANITETLAP